jgi:uncharacterized protein (DUF1919 family)
VLLRCERAEQASSLMLGFVCDFRSKGGRVFARRDEEWNLRIHRTNFCNLYTKIFAATQVSKEYVKKHFVTISYPKKTAFFLSAKVFLISS